MYNILYKVVRTNPRRKEVIFMNEKSKEQKVLSSEKANDMCVIIGVLCLAASIASCMYSTGYSIND